MGAVGAALTGRRGPGMPGSPRSFPGEYFSPAAGFASGKPLDVARGCATLASFLEDTAGDDDVYEGASDDELLGVIERLGPRPRRPWPPASTPRSRR